MIRIFTFIEIAFFCFLKPSIAQPALDWATTIGDSSGIFPLYVTNDQAGNVYVAGHFAHTQDFDPGPGTYRISSGARTTNFLMKLDGNKNFLWVDTFSSYIQKIHFDASGQMYILSYESTYLTYSKRDASYNLLWSRQIDGSTHIQGYDLNTDGSGNVYITGIYNGSTDFDAGPGVAMMNTFAPTAFILKTDDQGQYKWVADFRAALSHGYSLVLDDSANVYCSGLFADSIDFDPGPAKAMQNKGGVRQHGYLVKLDSNANYIWAKVFSSTGSTVVRRACLDKTGELVIGGTFTGILDADPGPGAVTMNSYKPGTCAYYMARLTHDGDYLWARPVGFSGNFFSVDVDLALDTFGNGYISGALGDTCLMNAGTPATYLNPIGGTDIFLSRINANGSFDWARSFGSKRNDIRGSMNVDAMGDVLLMARFYDSADVDPDAPVYNLHGYEWDSGDILATGLIKLSRCIGATSRNFRFACDSFEFEGVVYKRSGTYKKRFPTATCDSVAIIDLEINSDVKVTQAGNTLTAHTTYGFCQWLDCDNGMTPIPGATGKTFSPLKTGRYAVVISLAGCVDTSGCYATIGTGLDALPAAELTCYPNPTNGEIVISLGAEKAGVHIAVTDITGRIVLSAEALNQSNIKLNIPDPAGLYFIRVSENTGLQRVLKIVKQ